MSKLNVPMVDMTFMKKECLSDVPPMDFPFVVKEATGRSGQQVHLIESLEDWRLCYPTLNTTDLVIQSTQVQPGKDVRVFIVGKEIVGAVLRENKDDFRDRKSTRLNSSHVAISYAVFCLKKKKNTKVDITNNKTKCTV